jgi:hypothetical protein
MAFGLFAVICALFVSEMDYKLDDHIVVDLEKVKQQAKGGPTAKELEAQAEAEPAQPAVTEEVR